MSEVLRVESVTKVYGKKKVLSDVSFDIKAGEIVGLVGPNGAGKTTIMKIIAGLTPKYEGSVFINGEDIKDKNKNKRKMDTKDVGCIIETPGFYPNLTGYENLKFFAELSGVKEKKEIDDIVEGLELQNAINKKVSSYSLGMRQRLGIAQAMLSYPPLLILDEPTNGLDPNIIPEIRKLIMKMAKRKNTAVLISSHILSELEIMCDKIVFIQKGHIMIPKKKDENIITVSIASSNLNKLKKFLDEQELDKVTMRENEVEVVLNKNKIEELTGSIAGNNIPFSTVEKKIESLEDTFLSMMRGDIVD